MTMHHQWCTKTGLVVEGVCMECEHLRLFYPPLGHLDYYDMPDMPHIPESDPYPLKCSLLDIKNL